jgi:hypothetical protein
MLSIHFLLRRQGFGFPRAFLAKIVYALLASSIQARKCFINLFDVTFLSALSDLYAQQISSLCDIADVLFLWSKSFRDYYFNIL